MIQEGHGVLAAVLDRWDLPGATRIILHLCWKTEPGWIELCFDQPSLIIALEEVGGRCQVRACPDQPAEGEYFGTGHLSLIAAGRRVAIHAGEMRQARMAVYLFDPDGAEYLTPAEALAIRGGDNRTMFRDEAVEVCATALGRHERAEPDPYALSLTRALVAALLGALLPGRNPAPCPVLTGKTLDRVLAHILDNLDETVTVEDLAGIADLSPAQFGKAFREATGLSAQRWQMDAKVRNAQRLMVDDPDESLAEIAVLCGFSDQSHFSRAFLEIVGATPTAWLQQYK